MKLSKSNNDILYNTNMFTFDSQYVDSRLLMVSLPVTVHCKYPATFPPIVDSIVTSIMTNFQINKKLTLH